MRFNESNYNRHHVSELNDYWSDEWVVDRSGNLVLREEYGIDEIAMKTIKPEMGD